MKTIKQEYKPIEPTSCLENRLIGPLDLIPGIGYLTSKRTLHQYDMHTDEIEVNNKYPHPPIDLNNPKTRDMKSRMVASLMPLYHISFASAIANYDNIIVTACDLISKLF